MRSFVVCLAACVALSACDGSTSTGSTNVNLLELAQHEALWSQQGFHSYTYDYLNAGPLGAANVHVTVQADTIASLIDATTGMAPEFAVSVPTIDGLFTIVHGVLGEKNMSVHLEFDTAFGYPTLVSASDNNPGGPFVAHVSNLHPVQ
jgi:Family of unknown function (DUF6174)